MSYDPESDSQIKNKIKVELDSSIYATEKELDHAKGGFNDYNSFECKT